MASFATYMGGYIPLNDKDSNTIRPKGSKRHMHGNAAPESKTEKPKNDNVLPQVREVAYDAESDRKPDPKHSKLTQPQMTLTELRNLIYTRERLEELGCTFTYRGELIAYGCPESQQDFRHLLRLGPAYEGQWSKFFAKQPALRPKNEAYMWSDLRMLKKMLENEGIEFDSNHARLACNDVSYGVMRLCTAYDDMLKLWLSMVNARILSSGPTGLTTPSAERQDGGFSNPFGDSGYADDGGSQFEEDLHPAYRSGAGHRDSGIPRNIGWRFSDDLEESAETGELVEEPQEELGLTEGLPFSIEDDLVPAPLFAHGSSMVRGPSFRVANPTELYHYPMPRPSSSVYSRATHSSAGKASTDDATIGSDAVSYPSSNSLHNPHDLSSPRNPGWWARFIAAMAFDSQPEVTVGASTRKQGSRGRWQGVLGRK
jgi:hypothetical protein